MALQIRRARHFRTRTAAILIVVVNGSGYCLMVGVLCLKLHYKNNEGIKHHFSTAKTEIGQFICIGDRDYVCVQRWYYADHGGIMSLCCQQMAPGVLCSRTFLRRFTLATSSLFSSSVFHVIFIPKTVIIGRYLFFKRTVFTIRRYRVLAPLAEENIGTYCLSLYLKKKNHIITYLNGIWTLDSQGH
jgi:hypothetical protein